MDLNASDDAIVRTLNELIQTHQDAARGYREAAERIGDDAHTARFRERASERSAFAGELSAHVRSLGGTPATRRSGGDAEGALHRAWMGLRETLQGDAALLKEVDRGEEHAVARFEEALDAGLPEPILADVRRQAERVRTAHRDVHAAAHPEDAADARAEARGA